MTSLPWSMMATRSHVHALKRLVEHEDLGPMNQGGGHGQALAHALRVLGDQLAGLPV